MVRLALADTSRDRQTAHMQRGSCCHCKRCMVDQRGEVSGWSCQGTRSRHRKVVGRHLETDYSVSVEIHQARKPQSKLLKSDVTNQNSSVRARLQERKAGRHCLLFTGDDKLRPSHMQQSVKQKDVKAKLQHRTGLLRCCLPEDRYKARACQPRLSRYNRE